MALGDYTYRLKAESGDASPVDEVGGSVTLSGGTITLVDMGSGDYAWQFEGIASATGPSKTPSGTVDGDGITIAIRFSITTYDASSFAWLAGYGENASTDLGLALGQSGSSNVRARMHQGAATNATTTNRSVSTAIRTLVMRFRTRAASAQDRLEMWADGVTTSGDDADNVSSLSNYTGSGTLDTVYAGSSGSVFRVSDFVIWAEELSDADCHTLAESGIRASLDSGDATAPVLSSGSATETSDTTATLGATTDEGNGTLYWVVTTSATEPSEAQVKLGDDHADVDAAFAGSDAVGSTGAKTKGATGLTASTAYYAYAMHEDAAGNQSDVLYLGTFTTDATNASPVWDTAASDMSSKRGQALTPQDLSALVSDADMDTLAFSCSGLPTGVTCNSSTGIVSGTPTAAPGVYTVTPTIDDGVNSPVDGTDFDITVTQAVLVLNAAGYEFGDGNSPATTAVENAVAWEIAVVPDELPVVSTLYHSASSTTSSTGYLSDIGDDDFVFGTTYVLQARRVSDGEWITFPITAS